jgi:hypothetical protein
MRRWVAVGGLAMVLGAVPATALAVSGSGSGGGTSPVTCQSTRWTTTAVSAGPKFAPISALTTNFEAGFPVTVTVSGVVAGQPVAFKVVDHWIIPNQTARPGTVTVTPAGRRATPFSFTWVAPGSAAAVRGHAVTVDWRRTTASGSATLIKADVAVTYRPETCTGSGRSPT